MPFVQRTMPGEFWSPKSQDLNALAASANFTGRTGGAHPGIGGDSCLRPVYNCSDTTLSANCAVQVAGNAVLGSGPPLDAPLPVRLANDATAPAGVLQSKLAPGEVGSVIFGGIALAKVSGDMSLGFASPSNGFVASTAGYPILRYSASDHLACVLLGGIGNGTGTTGMFDTALKVTTSGESTTTQLVCWNSASTDDDTNAGIIAVNGQHFQVPRGSATIPANAERYLYVHFVPAHAAEDASDLDGTATTGEVAALAELYLWDGTLLQSSPSNVYVLIAIVHSNGTLEKVRPRGIIEAVWFGPAQDLWRDTIATGTTS